MAETNMTLKQSYNSSGEKIYPLVSVDGIIDAYGIDDLNHRGKKLIALSLQGLNINPERVDSSFLTVSKDGGVLTVNEGRIDIERLPVYVKESGLQVEGNIHSFNSISVSKDVSNGNPIAYGTIALDASRLTNGAKLTLMKKGDGNQPKSFFSVDNGKLEYYDVTITSTGFDFFNGVLKRDSTTKTLSTNSRFQVLNGSNTLLDVSNNGVIINKDTSILGTLTSSKNLTVLRDGASITGDTSIYGKLTVGDATTLNSTLNVKDDTSILGTLRVGKGASITGDVSVNGKLIVSNSVSKKGALIYGDTSILGKLNATGQTTLARGYDKGIVINTSNDSSYGKKVIWADDEYLRIKSHAKLDKDKTVGVQLLVGGDSDSDGYTASRVGIDLSSSRSSNGVWTDTITMKPAVKIEGTLRVSDSTNKKGAEIHGNVNVTDGILKVNPKGGGIIQIDCNNIDMWNKTKYTHDNEIVQIPDGGVIILTSDGSAKYDDTKDPIVFLKYDSNLKTGKVFYLLNNREDNKTINLVNYAYKDSNGKNKIRTVPISAWQGVLCFWKGDTYTFNSNKYIQCILCKTSYTSNFS